MARSRLSSPFLIVPPSTVATQIPLSQNTKRIGTWPYITRYEYTLTYTQIKLSYFHNEGLIYIIHIYKFGLNKDLPIYEHF